MVAVGIAITDLVMMEAILEMAEATMILAIIIINSSNFGPMKGGNFRAEVLTPVAVEANTLPNHETKVAMVVPAVAVAMAAATAVAGFNY